MRKSIKTIIAIGMATLTMFSATSVFAADYVNSTGSVANDITILTDVTYNVVGNDTTQIEHSEYGTVDALNLDTTVDGVTKQGDVIKNNVDVYGTIAEGSDVYDPTNPEADENGFVDGDILVGLPTVLIMSGTADANGYYVAEGKGKVKGNIAGTTTINVVPDASFTMSQSGKSDITATVTQDYTKFVVPTSSATGADVNKNVTPTFNDNAVFNVNVKTNQATAGSWHGAFNYTVSLTQAA